MRTQETERKEREREREGERNKTRGVARPEGSGVTVTDETVDHSLSTFLVTVIRHEHESAVLTDAFH